MSRSTLEAFNRRLHSQRQMKKSEPSVLLNKQLTGDSYLVMLQNIAVPQMSKHFIFQQDTIILSQYLCVPSYYQNDIRSFVK